MKTIDFIQKNILDLEINEKFDFIISDAVIALNKFSSPVEWSGPIVMTTYLAAQFLLVKGYKEFINGLKTSN